MVAVMHSGFLVYWGVFHKSQFLTVTLLFMLPVVDFTVGGEFCCSYQRTKDLQVFHAYGLNSVILSLLC